MVADEIRIRRERGLCDRCHAHVLGGQHEVSDVQTAIHCTVNPEILLGGDQREIENRLDGRPRHRFRQIFTTAITAANHFFEFHTTSPPPCFASCVPLSPP